MTSVHALNAIIGGTSDVAGQFASNIHSGGINEALSDINLGSTVISTVAGPFAGKAAVNTETIINKGLSHYFGETAVNMGGRLVGDVGGQFVSGGIGSLAAYLGGTHPLALHLDLSRFPPSVDFPGLYPNLPPLERQASLFSASNFGDQFGLTNSSLFHRNPSWLGNRFSDILPPPLELNFAP